MDIIDGILVILHLEKNLLSTHSKKKIKEICRKGRIRLHQLSGIGQTEIVVLYTNVKFTSLWIIMKIVQKFVAAIWKKLATNILKASIYSL